MTASRRTFPSHLSATLLALSVAVSLGAAGGAAAVVPAGLAPTDAPATHSTLLQRISAAARSLMGQAETKVQRRALAYRPALRSAADKSIPVDRRDALAPPVDTLHAHLLNLPPPARA